MSTWIDGTGPSTRPSYEYSLEPLLEAFEEFGFAKDGAELYVIKRMLAKRTTISSAQALKTSLIHFMRWCQERCIQIFEVTYDDADDYVADILRKRYASTTRSQWVSGARQFYEEALRRDHVAKNPFRFARVAKGQPITRTPSLTKTEVEQVLQAIYLERNDLEFGLTARRDYALLMLLAWTAMRSVEVERLRWMDFFLERDQVMLRIHGKGGKETDVPVSKDLIESLTDWRDAFESSRHFRFRPMDPVFPSLSPRHRFEVTTVGPNEPLGATTRHHLSEVVQRRLADVGIRGKRFRAHALRATAATIAYAAGADIAAVSRFLRHESLQTTQGYIDWNKAINAPAQDLLDYTIPGPAIDSARPHLDRSAPLERRGRRRKRIRRPVVRRSGLVTNPAV